VPYTGSTAPQRSATGCEPPEVGKTIVEPDRLRIEYYRRLWRALDRA
jgi:hypothetical protein